ncbi:unnamed protein product [Heterobilharzia americana]|nr:unnamed protein product [Heterobilharzia americana]
MTAHNVRQYLEKIYSVPVADVRVKMVHHDLPPVDIPQKERSGRSLDSTDYPPKPERYEKFAYVRLIYLKRNVQQKSSKNCQKILFLSLKRLLWHPISQNLRNFIVSKVLESGLHFDTSAF